MVGNYDIGDFVPHGFVYDGSAYTSFDHPLGTDGHGRDTLTDFLAGLQTTLFIGFLAGFLATIVGVVVGFISGYKGGLIDTSLITFTNILLVIPAYPILVGLTLVVPNKSMLTVALIVALFSWPFAARTIRAQVMSMKEQPYVELAKVTGQGDLKIIGARPPRLGPEVVVLNVEKDAPLRPIQAAVAKVVLRLRPPVREAPGDGQGRLQEQPKVRREADPADRLGPGNLVVVEARLEDDPVRPQVLDGFLEQ